MDDKASNDSSGGSDRFDGVLRDIDHRVEGWNKWISILKCSDVEKYVNGHINYAFKYMHRGGADDSQFAYRGASRNVPNCIAASAACDHIPIPKWEVRNLASDFGRGQYFVIGQWNKHSMLIRDIHLVDEVEWFVPTRFTIWFQPHKNRDEIWSNPIGESLLYGFVEVCPPLAERELQHSTLRFGGSERGEFFPIDVIKGSSKVVGGVTTDTCRFVQNRLVFFRPRDTLSGFGVCFNDVREGTLFAEQFVQFSDVLRGPVNFDESTVGHVQGPRC